MAWTGCIKYLSGLLSFAYPEICGKHTIKQTPNHTNHNTSGASEVPYINSACAALVARTWLVWQ